MVSNTSQARDTPSPEANESQWQFMHRVIAGQLDRTSASAKWYRGEHVRLQAVAIVLSGLVTVTAGVQSWLTDKAWTSVTILVLGALLTGLATWRGMFTPKESWHLNQQLYDQLRSLQTKMQFLERSPTFAPACSEVLKQIFDEYERILGQGNAGWERLRERDK